MDTKLPNNMVLADTLFTTYGFKLDRARCYFEWDGDYKLEGWDPYGEKVVVRVYNTPLTNAATITGAKGRRVAADENDWVRSLVKALAEYRWG